MPALSSEPSSGSYSTRVHPGRDHPDSAPGIFCFSIHAQAEPGMMPRVLQLFAKRNLVPDRWHSDVSGGPGRDLSIDIQVAGVDAELGNYIARCLRQIPGVAAVLTAEKHPAASRQPGALSA